MIDSRSNKYNSIRPFSVNGWISAEITDPEQSARSLAAPSYVFTASL